MAFCVKNMRTGNVRRSDSFKSKSAARSRCAQLNRQTKGNPFTVVRC